MKKVLMLCAFLCALVPGYAQRVLSLDSCRSLALNNNKQLAMSKMSKEMATEAKKAARTMYLPKLDVNGTYQYMSEEVSILNSDQKSTLSNLGTSFVSNLSSGLNEKITGLVMGGVITPEMAGQVGSLANQLGAPVAGALNDAGQKVVDAFRTDTRNIFGAAATISQPIYMGGAIVAANKMASISERMAQDNIDSRAQATIYEIDKAYWLVVSLREKQKLADSFLELVQKLDKDVKKMVDLGVATRSDGLKVAVKLNEAEMAKSQVDDGMVLARMLLCQLCGIEMDEDIKLADEESLSLSATALADEDRPLDISMRPELRLLEGAVDLSTQSKNLMRASYLPKVAAFGGYMISNPNVLNGFEKKFNGLFNVGVMVNIPVWHWLEGTHKVRAANAATNIAKLELEDAREKMNLQAKQNSFKIKEANHKYALAEKSIQSAEENLRCANLGFAEGVMSSTDVLMAQTAWLKAHTQKIDAEIAVRMAKVEMDKTLGTLNF